MIISKRHLFKFHITLYLLFSLCLLIGYTLIDIFIESLILDDIEFIDFLALFLGFTSLVIGFYSIWLYRKRAPIISLNKLNIFFGKEKYKIKDIDSIKLNGKIPFEYLFQNHQMEGICLIFKNGTKKYIYEKMYSDASQIKFFLAKNVLNKEPKNSPNYLFSRRDKI